MEPFLGLFASLKGRVVAKGHRCGKLHEDTLLRLRAGREQAWEDLDWIGTYWTLKKGEKHRSNINEDA